MRKLLPVLLMMASVWLAETSDAQFRTIPANARRATVGQPHVLPNVELNGKVVRLSPGGVIYDQNNRTIVHGALQSGADVAFVADMNGDVARIYILTPQERTLLDQRK